MISINLFRNVIEIAFRHGCSPVNLLYIFRTPMRAASENENQNNTKGTAEMAGNSIISEISDDLPTTNKVKVRFFRSRTVYD